MKGLIAKYAKTGPQIMLNWHLSRGYVPIPKSSSIDRIKENIGALDFELEPADVEAITALDKDLRSCDNYPWLMNESIFA